MIGINNKLTRISFPNEGDRNYYQSCEQAYSADNVRTSLFRPQIIDFQTHVIKLTKKKTTNTAYF